MGKGEAYINRDGMGYASAGTYSVPITSHEAGETFRELWAKCDGAGHVYGQRVNIQVSNIASTTSNAIRAEMDWLHASGHAAGGGAAIHAASELGTGNTGHAGLLAGLNAAIIVAAESRSLQGTYCALSLQTEFKTGNTMPATTSFIRMADAGAVDSPFLFDTAGIADDEDGTSGAWETTADAHSGTVLGYYRLRTVAGTGYVCVYADHA